MRLQRDFSVTVGLEDYTNKFITEAPITRERSRQRQDSLTAQELSMLRGVLGTASWRAQQMSPQFAVDVRLLLSAAAQLVVQDLLDANNLVRDVRRSSQPFSHKMRLAVQATVQADVSRAPLWFLLRITDFFAILSRWSTISFTTRS